MSHQSRSPSHRILVVPLYGRVNEFSTIEEALEFLNAHSTHEGSNEFLKYEILVEFSDGDRMDAFFNTKQKVREFLSFVSTQ